MDVPAAASGPALDSEDMPEGQMACFRLLERILARLHRELRTGSLAGVETGGEAGQWRQRLEERLFRRGRRVRFIDGGAGMGRPVEGVLYGIGAAGELLIMVDSETVPRSFITGELEVYGF
jgi:BirA family biotin operon repressor/biotin-[acetyl-CoA-carboxylase] ligase